MSGTRLTYCARFRRKSSLRRALLRICADVGKCHCGGLCNNCSRALPKPLVCARCKTAAYCSKDCQVHTAHRKRGGLAIKAVIDYSNAHTNANATE